MEQVKTEVKKKKLTMKDRLTVMCILLFVVTGGMITAASLLYGRNIETIIRNGVTAFICAGVVIFLYLDARQGKRLLYDNFDAPVRFFAGYGIGLVVSAVLPLITAEAWPYSVIFVALALFSNELTGYISGALLCTMSVMLTVNGGVYELIMYLIIGAVAVTLLRELTENTSIGFAVFMIMAVQITLDIAFNVIFQNRTLSPVMFVIPVVNLVISLMILLILLNMFGVYVIRGSKDRYMDVNDTEFPLLAALREKDRNEYLRAVHTCYLAERIALDLGLNVRAVKTMAYYHRIGIANGKNTWAEVEPLLEENGFPEEAIGYLKEYIESKPGERRSKEHTVINMSETVIASIMYLFAKDNKATLNVDALVDQIFANKMEDPAFHNSDISLYDMERMKAIMKKERLYYDFLR